MSRMKVYVRVRPMTQEECNNSHNVVELTTQELIIEDKERPRKFAFDRVFGPNSSQRDVYMSVVHPMISDVIAGYNCTVFAYGQTGTGKTFSMEGKNSCGAWDQDSPSGIIPRAVGNLFNELTTKEFTVRVSYLEIYNEELIDLLSDNVSKLRIFKDKKGSVIVHGLTEVTVKDINTLYRILKESSLNKKTTGTLMNARSSRSHTIFSITVQIMEDCLGQHHLKTGKLNMVDLAGSEDISRTGSVLSEVSKINRSLLTLGRVINASAGKKSHVPCRESKLTMLLQDSLGGRTKTSMLANISPAANSLQETICTLDYANKAKNITNRPELNPMITEKPIIKDFTIEIEKLKKSLAEECSQMKAKVQDQGHALTLLRTELEEQKELIHVLTDSKKSKEQQIDKLQRAEDLKDVPTENCNTSNGENLELKPPFTMAELIQQALRNKGHLTASEVSKWIPENYPYYKSRCNNDPKRWKQSIWRVLSKTKYFQKGMRAINSKEHYWEIVLPQCSTSRGALNTMSCGSEKTDFLEKEATQAPLLTVADSDCGTSDSSEFNDQMKLKRSVEATNEACNFCESVVQRVANLEDRVKRLTKDLNKFRSDLQTNLGEHCIELASPSNSRTLLIQELVKIISDQVEQLLKWTERFED